MLSKAKHLRLLLPCAIKTNDQRFFASLRMTKDSLANHELEDHFERIR